MTHPYYNDPIAAIYMAKHHGFILYTGAINGSDYERYTSFDFEGAPERWPNLASPIYVHPSSFEKLRGITGDMIAIANGREAHRLGTGGNKNVIMLQAGETIVQRNGKPFFWPEVHEYD